MKFFFLFLFSYAAMSFTNWQPDFNTAQKIAKQKHHLILLNFSGSDWCGPCIRMHREIFLDTQFAQMADSNLVLLNADFPRARKNQLDKLKQKQNDLLAEKYNPGGKFPFTLLLDVEGKLVKSWDGLPDNGALAFAKEIKKYCDAYSN